MSEKSLDEIHDEFKALKDAISMRLVGINFDEFDSPDRCPPLILWPELDEQITINLENADLNTAEICRNIAYWVATTITNQYIETLNDVIQLATKENRWDFQPIMDLTDANRLKHSEIYYYWYKRRKADIDAMKESLDRLMALQKDESE